MRKIVMVVFIFGMSVQARCFADDVDYLGNLVFGDATIDAGLGYTNNVGAENETGNVAPIKLNKAIEEYKITVGYSDKPLFRDLWLWSGRGDAVKEYLRLKKAEDPSIDLFWDAITIDASVGYGKTIEQSRITNKFNDTHQAIYNIGIKWKIPLDSLFRIKKWDLDTDD